MYHFVVLSICLLGELRHLSNLFTELKRRNVFKVATAYLVVGWLTIQVISSVTEPLGLPAWVPTLIIVLLAVGLPIALIFAWAFELTPDGVKKTEDVDEAASIAPQTSRKLDFVIIGALVLIIGGLVYTGKFSNQEVSLDEGEAVADAKSVAVLPFVDMSPNKDQDWFSDGLTEEILNSLAMLPELRVTARTSSFFFKGKNIPIPDIAEKLNVTYVVEGSVRRAGDTLRITAQLIRAKDDYHLWSNTYDKSVDEVLDVQSEVAEKIAQALDVVLDDKRRAQMTSSGTNNVQAFELYLKAKKLASRIHQKGQRETLWDANKLFDTVIELDPNYAVAYYESMDAYVHFLKDGSNSTYIRDKHPAGLTDKGALDEVSTLLEKSMEVTTTPIEKLFYEFERVAFSDNWTRLPIIVREMKKDPDAFARSPGEGAWTYNILEIIGEHQLVLKIALKKVEYDPLSAGVWSEVISTIKRLEGPTASLEKVRQAREHGIDHIWIDEAEIYAYVQLKDKAGLERMRDAISDSDSTLDALILSALGRKEEALTNIKHNSNGIPNETAVWAYHLMGEQVKAEAAAQQIDDSPLMVIYTGFLYGMAGKIPVTMDVMPNLVKRLSQAGLSEEKIQSMFLPSVDKGQ